MQRVVVAAAKASASKPIDLFVFDLDGTLIDATEDLVVSVNETLRTFGYPTLPADLIISHVGHGVRNLLQQTLQDARANNPDTPDNFEAAFKFLLKHYYENCLQHTKLYPGVAETLQQLHAQGKTIALCTNKTLLPSEKILAGFKIEHFFSVVVGGNSFPEKKPHPMGLQHILKTTGKPASRAVMVGDSSVDVEVGKAAGLFTCGCTYGLRPVQELLDAAPDHLISKFGDLTTHYV